MDSARPAIDPAGLEGAHVLLGVTGGIAAYKAAELARSLVKAGAEVQAVLTRGAEAFITRDTFAALTGRAVPRSIWDDAESVEHVALARWADVLVVAPATAHTIARLALGLADDLLTNVALAFGGPVVVAPAMHTEMWDHPVTQANLELLRARGALVVPPASGALTSGDVGVGRLAELADLLAGVGDALAPHRGPLAGRKVLVTLGGTREPLDPVRFLGNRSSGLMGAAVVTEALRRGAVVTAVVGAAGAPVPPAARRLRIETAQQLHDTVLAEAPDADVIIMAAAVADFRPKLVAERKLKKELGTPEVLLEPTPDALAELGRRRRPGQLLIGFAAETHDHLAAAERKRVAKHADLVVLNHVEAGRSAFESSAADAYLLDEHGATPLGVLPKTEVAARLLDWIEDHLSG